MAVWQEGATATVSVLDRRGKRGTVDLEQMPESGQGTITDWCMSPMKGVIQAMITTGASSR